MFTFILSTLQRRSASTVLSGPSSAPSCQVNTFPKGAEIDARALELEIYSSLREIVCNTSEEHLVSLRTFERTSRSILPYDLILVQCTARSWLPVAFYFKWGHKKPRRWTRRKVDKRARQKNETHEPFVRNEDINSWFTNPTWLHMLDWLNREDSKETTVSLRACHRTRFI